MFENKNILFVYSGLDNNLKVQQSFVFIKSLIDEIKENCKHISILTTTDEMGLFILDEDIKIYQDAINDRSIMNIIDEKKIDVLIPICGCEQTDKIINRIYQKLKDKKVEIFQEDYFLKDKSCTFFNNIARLSGFDIYRKKIVQNREKCREFFAVAINDNFENQVVFDICDTATINEKKFFLSPSILLQKNSKQNILELLKHFSKQIKVSNIPYTIHFSDYGDGKIYFEHIEFGFSSEMIFLLTAKRINIQKVIINGIKSLPIYYKQSCNYFACAYNYDANRGIDFAINFEELNFIVSINNTYKHTNNELFYRLCLLNRMNKECVKQITSMIDEKFYIQSTVNNNTMFDNRYEDGILVYVDDHTLNDIGGLIIFLQLCNRLKQETKKKLYFISSTYVPLFELCAIGSMFVINDNLQRNIEFIIKHFAVKKVFLNSFQNITEIINIFKNNAIDIYGFNYNDEIFYKNDLYVRDVFFEKLGLKYNEFYDEDGVVYDFFCITDKHNNEYHQVIVNNLFFKDVNVCGFLYPFLEMSFDVKEQLNNAINSILSNIQTAGIVHIKIIYNNGDIYINNINISMSFSILCKLNFLDKNKYFDCLMNAILGKNIDFFIRSNKVNDMKKFDKTIICNLDDNKTITINGRTQADIFSKFTKIIINNDV